MLLEARCVRKVYTTPRGPIAAVDGIDLEVRPGEFLAVCGRSGSGKSTLISILGGLCRPSAGTVRVDGVDLWSLGRSRLADFRARRLGFLFQFPGLLPNLRVIDNVAIPALLGGVGYDAAYDRALALLGQVGLRDRWDAHPGELSGGEQRRVAVCRALSNRPVLLLADEPTNDLDEQAELEVLGLLRELHRGHDTTLVVVTHDAKLARQADRVIHLNRGMLVSVVQPEPIAATIPATVLPATVEAEPARTGLAAQEPTPLGAGIGRFLVGFVGWTLLTLVVLWAVDYVTLTFQRKAIEGRNAVRRITEELGLQKLRANLDDVTYCQDGSYEVGVFLENYDPENPFYVLGPAVKVFVQVNRTWQEVPASPVGFEDRAVRPIAERSVFRFSVRANLAHYDELLKGYMHVRVSNVMIVSATAEPTTDLFQRTDDYYLYLRPQAVSEDEVRKLNRWNPGALVPRWIGMPAH